LCFQSREKEIINKKRSKKKDREIREATTGAGEEREKSASPREKKLYLALYGIPSPLKEKKTSGGGVRDRDSGSMVGEVEEVL